MLDRRDARMSPHLGAYIKSSAVVQGRARHLSRCRERVSSLEASCLRTRRTSRSSSTRAGGGGATLRRSASTSRLARTPRCSPRSHWTPQWCRLRIITLRVRITYRTRCIVALFVECARRWQPCAHAGLILALQNSQYALQDVFSLGCVIAELFLEGRALFDLSKVRSIDCMQPVHHGHACLVDLHMCFHFET